MALTIRSAAPSDHPRLLELWRASVEATHHFLAPADIDWYEEVVAGYLPQLGDLRVAVDDGGDTEGEVVGFISHDDGEIHMLFVDPAVHGQGVGTSLLEDVGADGAELRVDVNEQNPVARGFYLARGFAEVGRSELDGEGRPFPLLHLRREARAAA